VGLETTLVVERVAFGGKGLGRVEGKVCFVPRVLPGERVAVQIRHRKAGYMEADLAKVLEASPDRIKPPCPVYGRCGGCHYQHATYERQLLLKWEQVEEVLRRLGGIRDVEIEPVAPSPLEFHYRNRITVHVKGGRVGFYGARSRKIIEISQCPIASAAVNAQLAEFRASSPPDGEHALREPHEFRGFRQVNDAQAPTLLEIVAEYAHPGGELLVDGYCGAGFFAKRLKPLFKLTIGIEWSADAVRAARAGVGEDEIYLLGDIKRHLAPALAAAPPESTMLLLDPPAEGLHEEVVSLILARRPQRLIYVSCNPSTLARDLKRLGAQYRPLRIRPVDMFPQTAEIEVAALAELK